MEDFKVLTIKQQWDFHMTVKFIYLTKKDEYIGSLTLDIYEDETSLNSLYIDNKHRRKGYTEKMLDLAVDYSNMYLKNDLTLVVRRDNFILKKYKEYGFEECDEKESENSMYIKLILKY